MSNIAQFDTAQAVYYAADSLGIPLFKKPSSGKTRGASPVEFLIGEFWTETVDMIVESDESGGKLVSSFMVRVAGSLWMYLVVESTGSRMWLYLIDGDAAGLRVGDLAVHLTGTTDTTLKNLAPAIRGKFKYADKHWSPWTD